jgi:ABC-2 type transport system permease protein
VQALTDATQGDWPSPGRLALLAGYAVVSLVLGIRLFRWE